MTFRTRLLIFGYPLAEILALWAVASVIGWGWALLGILAGLPIGFALMRNAGSSAARLIQANQEGDRQGANALASTMTGQFAAGLLIAVPGYVTYVVGLAMLIPRVRTFVGRTLKDRYQGSAWMNRMPGSGPIIQGTVIVQDIRYETPSDSGDDPRPAIER